MGTRKKEKVKYHQARAIIDDTILTGEPFTVSSLHQAVEDMIGERVEGISAFMTVEAYINTLNSEKTIVPLPSENDDDEETYILRKVVE